MTDTLQDADVDRFGQYTVEIVGDGLAVVLDGQGREVGSGPYDACLRLAEQHDVADRWADA